MWRKSRGGHWRTQAETDIGAGVTGDAACSDHLAGEEEASCAGGQVEVGTGNREDVIGERSMGNTVSHQRWARV